MSNDQIYNGDITDARGSAIVVYSGNIAYEVGKTIAEGDKHIALYQEGIERLRALEANSAQMESSPDQIE
jgi:hypothetical protein